MSEFWLRYGSKCFRNYRIIFQVRTDFSVLEKLKKGGEESRKMGIFLIFSSNDSEQFIGLD